MNKKSTPFNYLKKNPIAPDSSRRHFLKNLGVLSASTGLFLAGCHQMSSGLSPQDGAFSHPLDGGLDAQSPQDSRPRLDLLAPTNTQMASFALG